MGNTSQYNVREVFAGVWISMEMNCMVRKLMELHSRHVQINPLQVFQDMIWICSDKQCNFELSFLKIVLVLCTIKKCSEDTFSVIITTRNKQITSAVFFTELFFLNENRCEDYMSERKRYQSTTASGLNEVTAAIDATGSTMVVHGEM